MPTQNRVWLHQKHDVAKTRNDSREGSNQAALMRPKRRTFDLPCSNEELLSQQNVPVPDGVFTLSSGAERAAVHQLPSPAQSDLEAIAFNFDVRVRTWLRRKHLLIEDADHFCNEPPQRTAIDACLEGSLGLGELTRLPARNAAEPDDEHGQQLQLVD